jgi:uncharacterized protein YndB with AHSA1/START domain
MWTQEHQDRTAAGPETVWRLLSDVSSWPTWNPDVMAAEIDGAFAVGATIRMSIASGDVIPLRLAEVEENRRFVDEAELDGILVRTDHRLEADGSSGTRVVYAITVSGEAPDAVLAEVGEGISADFPQTLAGLVAAASGA